MIRSWSRLLLAVIALACACALLWVLFGPLATWLGGPALDRLDAKDQLAAVSTIRGQIGAVVSAAFVGGGLYYTGRKFFLDRDKQFTDRFNSAVDHLGSDQVTVRAGGVRALDRILHDSPRDRNRVLETVTGFLRHHADSPAAYDRDDVSAAIAALRNRGTPAKNECVLDLRRVRLAEAQLRGIPFAGADLCDAELTAAVLTGADLRAALLRKATLVRADLTDAVLAGADLRDACLAGACLAGADLRGASLAGTDFTGATLTGTDLRGTDLTETVGLTADRLTRALTDGTVSPPGGEAGPAS